MSWNISLMENTVTVSPDCAVDLFNAQEYEGEIWETVEDVSYDGKIYFNSDFSEWMDFLRNNTKFIEILKKHNSHGQILFGSLEGDDFGSFWGHRFDGKGNYNELKGALVWVEKTKS